MQRGTQGVSSQSTSVGETSSNRDERERRLQTGKRAIVPRAGRANNQMRQPDDNSKGIEERLDSDETAPRKRRQKTRERATSTDANPVKSGVPSGVKQSAKPRVTSDVTIIIERLDRIENMLRRIHQYLEKMTSVDRDNKEKLENVRKNLLLETEKIFKEIETMIMKHPRIHGELMAHLNALPNITFNKQSDKMLNALMSQQLATHFTAYGTPIKFFLSSFLTKTRIGGLLLEGLSITYPNESRECIVRIIKLLAGFGVKETRNQRKETNSEIIIGRRRDMSAITSNLQVKAKSESINANRIDESNAIVTIDSTKTKITVNF